MTLAGLLLGPPARAAAWQAHWRQHWPATRVALLLAATETAAVPGISAAGATPDSRRATAAADAELLLLGPEGERPHALPPLPAGVTPALISHVVLRSLGLTPWVVDLGCAVAPAIPHLRLPPPAGAGSARCLSTGAAMAPARALALLEQGRRWGRRLADRPRSAPLLLAECVPGGTTTALGVLCGLGVEATGLVSGSLRLPAHDLKQALVDQGLGALRERLGEAGARDPLMVAAALGDPMQPLAAGLLLEATRGGAPVMLAGGSQMAAVLALALALARPEERPRLNQATALATTRWVAGEPGSDLPSLLGRIGERWRVDPVAFHAALAFHGAGHPALARYEEGYVKEGVGAGGLALLWELSGGAPAELAQRCSLACHRLHAAPGMETQPRQRTGERPETEENPGTEERLASSDG
ncbi:MAG: TIGR00303 family protein [Cyanobacteriota bacterium]|nr:TIGR00303 family protein [Cyanobacteriota bacterium]